MYVMTIDSPAEVNGCILLVWKRAVIPKKDIMQSRVQPTGRFPVPRNTVSLLLILKRLSIAMLIPSVEYGDTSL